MSQPGGAEKELCFYKFAQATESPQPGCMPWQIGIKQFAIAAISSFRIGEMRKLSRMAEKLFWRMFFCAVLALNALFIAGKRNAKQSFLPLQKRVDTFLGIYSFKWSFSRDASNGGK